MARRRTTLPPAPDAAVRARLSGVFDAIRAELGVPEELPPEVVSAAQEAASAAAAAAADLPDLTDVPFCTIDPPGSMDLDQAMHLSRADGGYRVLYAIADLPLVVPPGGPVDEEARRRGQTLYAPDGSTPLHPRILSEGAASLLPGEVRAAYVWDITLDSDGEPTSVDLSRARVRSRDRFDYAHVQAAVDDGTDDERLLLLREVGLLRQKAERGRGGASLPMPDQEVVETPEGYALRFRPAVPAEDWNAQISLLTGMAAADLMLAGQVGILRTMPEPDARALQRFHRQAAALGVPWPAETSYGDFLASLDRSEPHHMALIHEAAALFRGASYTPFVGAVPEQALHSAVAAPYAHVTAPLRRLVDRFALVVCEALCRGTEVPDWVVQALPTLPSVMAESDRRAGALDRACTDAVEAAVLQPHVGDTFEATVVDVDDKGEGGLGDVPLGKRVSVRLAEASVEERKVVFTPA